MAHYRAYKNYVTHKYQAEPSLAQKKVTHKKGVKYGKT
jgi:hypothetical protein